MQVAVDAIDITAVFDFDASAVTVLDGLNQAIASGTPNNPTFVHSFIHI